MMKSKAISPSYCNDTEIRRSFRYLPPADCIAKIQGFSMLSQFLQKVDMDKHEFEDFEAYGYKWRMSLYPRGDKTVNGGSRISLYLEISEELPCGWELHVMVKFFVHNQLRDEYLTIEDGKPWRLNALNKGRGISKVLALATFNDTSNGYLVNDCCVFGAEVFILNCQPKIQSLSMVRDPENGTYTFEINNFKAKVDLETSPVFEVQGQKWTILIHPKGQAGCKDFLSLFLKLNEMDKWEHKVYVEFDLCVKNQVNNAKHKTDSTAQMFSNTRTSWGYPKFLALSELHGAKNGFIVADRVIVEVKITSISVIHQLTE